MIFNRNKNFILGSGFVSFTDPNILVFLQSSIILPSGISIGNIRGFASIVKDESLYFSRCIDIYNYNQLQECYGIYVNSYLDGSVVNQLTVFDPYYLESVLGVSPGNIQLGITCQVVGDNYGPRLVSITTACGTMRNDTGAIISAIGTPFAHNRYSCISNPGYGCPCDYSILRIASLFYGGTITTTYNP